MELIKIKQMKIKQIKINTMKVLSVMMAVLVMQSCATISYNPKISLDVSPKTIEGSLMVEKIVDNTPIEDRKNPFSGFSVTNEQSLINDLSIEVSNEIVSDFSNNAVFSKVSRSIKNPDYILEGEMTKFMGRTKLTTYGLISFITIIGVITWYFGLPVQKMEVEMDITLRLLDGNRNLIGTYSGTASGFDRVSMYNNIALKTPNQTNKEFSNVIANIREQIIKDLTK